MSYIGRDLRTGAFRQLDDISSSFNSSTTGFTMQVNSTNVSVGDVNQILLSLGGVIQKPGTDFTVSGSTLTFTTAPAANTNFFAILLGSDNGGTVTPTDGSVTGDKIANNLAIATNVSISTADNTDTLTLKSTDADASVGPVLTLHRESSSPADDDIIGRINFIGEDSGGTDTTYGRIGVKVCIYKGDILPYKSQMEDKATREAAMAVGETSGPSAEPKTVVSSAAARRRSADSDTNEVEVSDAEQESPNFEDEELEMTPLVKEGDEAFEKLLAEEEEIERSTHDSRETPHFRLESGD